MPPVGRLAAKYRGDLFQRWEILLMLISTLKHIAEICFNVESYADMFFSMLKDIAESYFDVEQYCGFVFQRWKILRTVISTSKYGQFSKVNVYVCGLDSGNLKFETVRTHKQHICF